MLMAHTSVFVVRASSMLSVVRRGGQKAMAKAASALVANKEHDQHSHLLRCFARHNKR